MITFIQSGFVFNFSRLAQSFIMVLLVITQVSFAQDKTVSYLKDDGLVPREHSVDMLHLLLEVEFEPEQGKVIGRVTHSFRTLQPDLDSLFLDGPGIEVSSVTLDGKKMQYKSNDEGVILYLDKQLGWGTKHSLSIDYTAKPRKGIYFIGWNDEKNLSRKQIWTQGQGIDNRHWIPCYDSPNDKITTELFVKFDSKYKVLSNGNKVAENIDSDGNTYWHYQMTKPHVSYLIMLGIGEYEIKTIQSTRGVPIHLWYYPEWENRVSHTYKYSAEMMDFFEKEIGVEYPWETYSQIPVQDFLYGAMENTTATIFGDFFMVDERGYWDRNYVAVNAHELAHQWFGDYVTARSGAHHWLQESFATHYNWLYEREVFGQDHYDWGRKKAIDQALEASKKDDRSIAHSKAGSIRHYPKGAFVLSMLKYVTGREQYNASVKHYLEKHGYQNVDSEDLLIAFHETLGLSLNWFWDQWVYRGGEPHYKVNTEEVSLNGIQQSVFHVDQVQEQNDIVGLFKMPVVFEVHYEDGTVDSRKKWIEEAHHDVYISNPDNKKVAFMLFDPNSQVMKKVEMKQSKVMWMNQAQKAGNMLDRYNALLMLRDIEMDNKRELLSDIYKSARFHAIKSEIIKQILDAEDHKSYSIVKAAIEDEDAAVRKSTLTDNKIPEDLENAYQKLLSDASYETVEKALRKLCLEFPDKSAEYLEATKDERGIKGLNIRITWLEMQYSNASDSASIEELAGYTGASYEFLTRKNAAEALQRINYCNDLIVMNLMNAITNPNSRLSSVCGEVLKHFYKQPTYRILIDKNLKDGNFGEKETTKISKYLS